MTEEERFESEDSEDDVEAHKRRLAKETTEADDDGDSDGDDVEAHRRRA